MKIAEGPLTKDELVECSEMFSFLADWLTDQPVHAQEALDSFSSGYDWRELRWALLYWSRRLLEAG